MVGETEKLSDEKLLDEKYGGMLLEFLRIKGKVDGLEKKVVEFYETAIILARRLEKKGAKEEREKIDGRVRKIIGLD